MTRRAKNVGVFLVNGALGYRSVRKNRERNQRRFVAFWGAGLFSRDDVAHACVSLYPQKCLQTMRAALLNLATREHLSSFTQSKGSVFNDQIIITSHFLNAVCSAYAPIAMLPA